MNFNIFRGILKANQLNNSFNLSLLSKGDWTTIFDFFKYSPQIVFDFTMVIQIKSFLYWLGFVLDLWFVWW